MASVGVNVTESVWLPLVTRVPAAGVYTNVPGSAAPVTPAAVASSCVEVSGEPTTRPAGVGHVSTGVACVTAMDAVPLTGRKSVASLGVKVTRSVCAPAVSTEPAAGA